MTVANRLKIRRGTVTEMRMIDEAAEGQRIEFDESLGEDGSV